MCMSPIAYMRGLELMICHKTYLPTGKFQVHQLEPPPPRPAGPIIFSKSGFTRIHLICVSLFPKILTHSPGAVGQSKKKKKTPINSNTNYRREMKFNQHGGTL